MNFLERTELRLVRRLLPLLDLPLPSPYLCLHSASAAFWHSLTLHCLQVLPEIKPAVLMLLPDNLYQLATKVTAKIAKKGKLPRCGHFRCLVFH